MKKAQSKPDNDKRASTRLQTAVYLPLDLVERLSRYQLEVFSGRMHRRNEVILAALDKYLKSKGY